MRKRRVLLVAFGAITATIAAWFLCVDWSWFVETCPDCCSSCSIGNYRICGIPISEKRYPNTMMLELVCADLGVPCTHPAMTRWHKHRWWGLCICAYPCHNGIIGFAGDADDYTPAMSARVKALAKENPKLSDEFHQRVLAEHDYEYWHTFAKRMKSP